MYIPQLIIKTILKPVPLAFSTFILDIFFFINTNPNRGSIFIVLLGYILLLMTIYVLCVIGAKFLLIFNLVDSINKKTITRFSLFLWLLVIIQSIGQLSVLDWALFILISLISYFYFIRVQSTRNTD